MAGNHRQRNQSGLGVDWKRLKKIEGCRKGLMLGYLKVIIEDSYDRIPGLREDEKREDEVVIGNNE